MDYPMNIAIVSAVNDQCSQISIQSNGEAYDRWYGKNIFSSYRFASIDARGNTIYYANSKGADWFICKDMYNAWQVRI